MEKVINGVKPVYGGIYMNNNLLNLKYKKKIFELRKKLFILRRVKGKLKYEIILCKKKCLNISVEQFVSLNTYQLYLTKCGLSDRKTLQYYLITFANRSCETHWTWPKRF